LEKGRKSEGQVEINFHHSHFNLAEPSSQRSILAKFDARTTTLVSIRIIAFAGDLREVSISLTTYHKLLLFSGQFDS
jgi:hypothetical protein